MSRARTRNARAVVSIAATLIVVILTATPLQAQAASSERAAREVIEAFRSALRAGDSTAVISLLHPEVRIYEGGHAETRDEYRSGHLRGDIAFLRAVTSEKTWDHLEVEGDLALYMSEDRKTGTYRDREIDSRGTETIVLAMTPEGWRIRHIHWSSR